MYRPWHSSAPASNIYFVGGGGGGVLRTQEQAPISVLIQLSIVNLKFDHLTDNIVKVDLAEGLSLPRILHFYPQHWSCLVMLLFGNRQSFLYIINIRSNISG